MHITIIRTFVISPITPSRVDIRITRVDVMKVGMCGRMIGCAERLWPHMFSIKGGPISFRHGRVPVQQPDSIWVVGAFIELFDGVANVESVTAVWQHFVIDD